MAAVLFSLVLIAAFSLVLIAALDPTSGVARGATDSASSANPVISGAFPDPTVIKVGREYVASATSNGWAPIFPILHSRDLVHWRQKGAVFRSRPKWAVGRFWAPELAHVGGRYLAYYSAIPARRRYCIGVATAGRVDGPYRDVGPILCPPRGAIDPFTVRDENGRLFLLWKESGDAVRIYPAIRAQPLTPDGLRLTGSPTTLITADQPWERGVVEAPAVMRERGKFFLFYAGARCCRTDCRYSVGVAASPRLLGPWRKRPANPILRDNAFWRCPGHGSPVRAGPGDHRLLYHAFRADSFLIGRQVLMDPIRIGGDGWPEIGTGSPSVLPVSAAARPRAFREEFRGRRLARGWEWPAVDKPRIAVGGGRLRLGARRRAGSPPDAALLTRRTTSTSYEGLAVLDRRDLRGGASGGLGPTTRDGTPNEGTSVFASARGRRVVLLRRQAGRLTKLASAPRPRLRTFLRVRARGDRFAFAVSADGRRWRDLGATQTGSFEQGVRLALFAGGHAGKLAGFQRVRLTPR